MPDFLQRYTFRIRSVKESPFMNRIGIYQDGTTPLCRDADGRLWAMSGHSHMGHIGMFCGSSLDDLREMWSIETDFEVGHADRAFGGIRYPDGIKARGSIWPFGLYICPKTHRFFCFFHNETGWNGKGSAYDALGYCDKPHYDSDFRHVGLMHSDDEGRHWRFDRWVLTAETASFTTIFRPEEAGVAVGQPAGEIKLGSGDFSLFAHPNDPYLYLVYNIVRVNTDESCWKGCDTYIARTRKREDGLMGDFVKQYDGQWCEAGNFGKESIVAPNTWHSKVVYLQKYGVYLMTSTRVAPNGSTVSLVPEVDFRVSTDLVTWSEPVGGVTFEGRPFGNHYVAIAPIDAEANAGVIVGDELCFLTNHNGTDVMRFDAEIVPRQ